LAGAAEVGVTAGSSTPDYVTEEVKQSLAKL
jgi:4-hydroxy-3-methylbut-2-enyl diphosphate reductase IspH